MSPKPCRTILVAIDLSSDMEAETDAAIARAFAFATTLEATERIHLLYVEKTPGIWMPAPGLEGAMQEAWETVATSATRLLDRLVVPQTKMSVTREVSLGPPTKQILASARAIEADMIVLATRGRGALARLALGSVASAVVRGAPCPVLIVAKDRRGPASMRRLLVGVDGSLVCARVVEQAASIARATHGEAHLVAVFQEPQLMLSSALSPAIPAEPTRAILRAHCAAALESCVAVIRDPNIKLFAKIVEAPYPGDEIVEQADHVDADLIVIGSSGHNAWQRLFLGSTAGKVIAHAHCAVLVVP